MLLSEKLLLESMLDERNLIFDQPELIAKTKQIFATAPITCHALDIDRHANTIRILRAVEHHSIAKILFPLEYATFEATKTELIKQCSYAEKLYSANEAKIARNKLNSYLHIGCVPCKSDRSEMLANLYPYGLSSNNTIACIYHNDDNSKRAKIVVDLNTGKIVTIYEITSSYIDQRIVEFASLELLALKIYGTTEVEPIDMYAALKTFKPSILTDKIKTTLFTKFCQKYNIAPQVRQQVFRKFDTELASQSDDAT